MRSIQLNIERLGSFAVITWLDVPNGRSSKQLFHVGVDSTGDKFKEGALLACAGMKVLRSKFSILSHHG